MHIKVTFQDEIRRFSMEQPNYAELETQVKQVYTLANDATVKMKYLDDEKDWISVNTDLELKMAFDLSKTSGILRIQVERAGNAVGVHPLVRRTAPIFKNVERIVELAKKKQCPQEKEEPIQNPNSWAGRFKKRDQGWKNGPFAELFVMNRAAARLVKDVTIPEGSELSPGDSFVKTWRIRNESTLEWPAHFTVVFKRGDQFSKGQTIFPIGKAVKPGEEVEVSITGVAPQNPGKYVAIYRLSGPKGMRFFGERLELKFRVRTQSDDEKEFIPEKPKAVEPVVIVAAPENSNLYAKIAPVNVAPSAPPMEEFAKENTTLREMGFNDDNKNRNLLKKFNGDVVKVIGAYLKNINA
jgi:hypothetical protein